MIFIICYYSHVCCAVAPETAYTARFAQAVQVAQTAQIDNSVRLEASAAFRYLCGSRRMGIRMIKSLYFIFLWLKLLITL